MTSISVNFSIRAMCGLDLQRNCVHGSDSPQSAAREISFFFNKPFSGQSSFSTVFDLTSYDQIN